MRIAPGTLCAIKDEHSRCVSLFEGLLRDQFLRKLVIEVRDVHGSEI
jgi:hypothetical protein